MKSLSEIDFQLYFEVPEMQIWFEQLNPHACKTYLIGTKDANTAIIIDPVLEHVGDYYDLLQKRGLKLTHILETHTHADHISGAAALKDRTDAELIMHENSPAKCVTKHVQDNLVLSLNGIRIEVIESFGHTKDSVSYIVDDKIFTGDALFLDDGGAGRDDLPGGDPELHWYTLQRLLRLPTHLMVYPAHDYRNREPSSLNQQRLSNPHLKIKSKMDFINYLNDLKLGPANWMKDVLKANYHCARDPGAAWIPVDAPACEVKGSLALGVNEQTFKTIPAIELKKLIAIGEKPFMIDVREPYELKSELGGIKGAKNIPIVKLIGQLSELSSHKDKPVFLICRSGSRAATAAQIMKQMGFQHPIVMENGMLGWKMIA